MNHFTQLTRFASVGAAAYAVRCLLFGALAVTVDEDVEYIGIGDEVVFFRHNIRFDGVVTSTDPVAQVAVVEYIAFDAYGNEWAARRWVGVDDMMLRSAWQAQQDAPAFTSAS